MRQHTVGDVTFFDEFADITAEITPEEWKYYDLADEISDQITEFMAARKISKADLARSLGKSKAFVSKVLRGDANITVKTLSSVLHHLEARIEFRIAGENDFVQWQALVNESVFPLKQHVALEISSPEIVFDQQTVLAA